jgi:CheY-like chemotaxis protein
VIDDEEFCITSMTAILKKIGVDVKNQVDYCMTGIEAIEKLKETYLSDMKYKFIFTDFNMPEMDGIQASYKMREFLEIDMQLPRKDQPKIIGLTGHVEDNFKLNGMRAGMDDVKGKPIYLREIEEILKNNIIME